MAARPKRLSSCRGRGVLVEYKNVGQHAEDLASGQTLAPGETVELDDEAIRLPHNEDLIARGTLMALDKEAAHEAKLASRRVTRREQGEGGEDS